MWDAIGSWGGNNAGASKAAYLIPESGTVLVHVNATDLHNGTAKAGPVWTLTGTAPAYNAGAVPRPSVGPLGSAGTPGGYNLPATNPLNAAGSFSGVAIYTPTSSDISAGNSPLSDGFYQVSLVAGWAVQASFGLRTSNGTGNSSVGGGLDVANMLSIVQFGYDSVADVIAFQMNGGTYLTTASAIYSPNTANTAHIGGFNNQGFNGSVIEVYATAVAPSAAAFTAIYNSIVAAE